MAKWFLILFPLFLRFFSMSMSQVPNQQLLIMSVCQEKIQEGLDISPFDLATCRRNNQVQSSVVF